MRIEVLTSADEEKTLDIFNYYVEKTNVSPEEIPRSPTEHKQVLRDALSKYVATDETGIIGFAFAKPHAKGRKCFDPAVEIGVYIRKDKRGCGVGTQLVSQLIRDMKSLGKHTALAKINADNMGSAKLFLKLGFAEVARLHEIGIKFETRITVVYLQIMLQDGDKC